MKKILNALFVALLAVFTFSSCSDVPAPYEILEPGSGNQGGMQGGDAANPFGLDASNPVNDFSADFEEQPDFTPDGKFDSNLNYDYELVGWKNVAEVGDRKWTGVVFKSGEKYLRASSNKGKEASYTSWFISPAFNVEQIKDKTVSFDCAGAFFYQTTTLKVYFLELVDGVMKKTPLAVNGIPTSGENYKWVKGINVDLKDFAGKVGFIGFEYVGEGGEKKSTTYTLDNIKCGKAEAQPEKPQPEKPQETVVVTNDKPFSATFATTEDGFIADDVTIDPALSYVWKHDAGRGQFKASASKKDASGQYVNYVTESLLKSPLLDLTALTKVVLTFDHFTNFMKGADNKQYFSVQVQEDGQTTWEAVAIPTYPAKDGYDFVASGDMDLSKYAGKKIVVAFKYTSDAKAAGTWGLKNVKVCNGEGGGQQGGGDQGGQTDPQKPADSTLKNLSFETWANKAPEGWGTSKVNSVTFSESTDAYDGTKSVLLKGDTQNKRFASDALKLAEGTYTLTVYAKKAAGNGGKIRLGYVPLKADGAAESNQAYKYLTDATAVTDAWTAYSAEFTVDAALAAKNMSVFVASGKSGNGNDFLIDKISLTKK